MSNKRFSERKPADSLGVRHERHRRLDPIGDSEPPPIRGIGSFEQFGSDSCSRPAVPGRSLNPTLIGGSHLLMNIFKWFERKLFTGEVIRDYGDLQDDNMGVARLRTSVLLCRRKGKLKLVIRRIGTAPLSASVQYSTIDVTPKTLERLGQIVLDAKQKLEETLPLDRSR